MKDYKPTFEFIKSLRNEKLYYTQLDSSSTNLIEEESYYRLVHYAYRGEIKQKIRAICVLARLHKVPIKDVSQMLNISKTTVNRYYKNYKIKREPDFFIIIKTGPKSCKRKDPEYINAIFSILHSPPSSFGINRTTWRLQDIKEVMSDKGFSISKAYISKVIKDAGYNYRKSRTVLTSNDPEYREKLKNITKILSNLKPTEKFFSRKDLPRRYSLVASLV